MRKGDRKIHFLAAIWIFLLAPSLGAEKIPLPQYLPRTEESLTMQEKWVLARLAQGEEADLNQLPTPDIENEEIKTLRAKFLESLLTNDFPNYKIHWHGVKIKNATIRDELNLEHGEIPLEVRIDHCVFSDRVNMKECRFKRSLWIMDSRFKKEADCLRIEIAQNGYFNNCIFQGSVNFGWGRIGEEFSLIGAQFTNTKEAKFEGIKAGTNIYALNASFAGDLNFQRVISGNNMEFNDATFWGKADFTEISVNGNLGLHRAVFMNGAIFPRAKVEKAFLAEELKFYNENEFASFPGMRIAHGAELSQGYFCGPVDLNGVTVGDSLNVGRATFKNHLFAAGLSIKDTLSFRETEFFRRVLFAGAEVGGQLNIHGAKFMDEKEGVEAYGLKVGQLVEASDVFFAGPLNLEGAKIGGKLRAEAVINKKKDKGLVFVHGIFLQEILLQDAVLSDLVINASNLQISTLNLNRLVVNHDLTMQDILIDDLLGRRLVCKGQTEFKNIVFKQGVDLQDCNFSGLKFSEVSWPEKSGAVNLSGLTYQTISGKSEASILAWLNNAQFEAQNYTTYQKYLEKINKADWADKVFIAMKRREWGGQSWKEWLNPIHWPLILLWDLPVGYGRKPQNILWFALPMIILGAIVLDPRYLDGISWPQKNKWYNAVGRLLLSVDKFTPKLLEFGFEDRWQPPELSGSMQFFLHAFKLMGKVFLSIFFIAIYARFK